MTNNVTVIISEHDAKLAKAVLQMRAAIMNFGTRLEKKKTAKSLQTMLDWLLRKYEIRENTLEIYIDRWAIEIGQRGIIRPSNTIQPYEDAMKEIKNQMKGWK